MHNIVNLATFEVVEMPDWDCPKGLDNFKHPAEKIGNKLKKMSKEPQNIGKEARKMHNEAEKSSTTLNVGDAQCCPSCGV